MPKRWSPPPSRSSDGRLDILINNAGTPGVREPVEWPRLDLITEELWQRVISVNLLGLFRCTKAAAEALRASSGAVVNLASIAGLHAKGSSMAYGATKAGVVSLTKNLACALAPEVRVNAVAPGAVDTPWTEAWPEDRKRDLAEAARPETALHPGGHRRSNRVPRLRGRDGDGTNDRRGWRAHAVTRPVIVSCALTGRRRHHRRQPARPDHAGADRPRGAGARTARARRSSIFMCAIRKPANRAVTSDFIATRSRGCATREPM